MLFSATASAVKGGEKETGQANCGVSYNNLKNMIEEMGGKVSATVHKNVNFLIASENAVLSATQRVRKAFKFRIPVLRIEYIQDLYNEKAHTNDILQYVCTNVEQYIDSYEKEKNKSKSEIKDWGQCAEDTIPQSFNGTSEKYEVPSSTPIQVSGCSCICHDRGEVSCSWCADSHTSHPKTRDSSDDSTSKKKSKKSSKRKKKDNNNVTAHSHKKRKT